MNIALTYGSDNAKTGPIPTSVSSRDTCPDVCPLKAGGCYASLGHLLWHWRQVTTGARGTSYEEFLRGVEEMPRGQLWRHNVAGDLFARADYRIDQEALQALVKANGGKRGFTYTHHDMAVEENRQAVAAANQAGFTINLSANNLAHADWLADFAIGPVVSVLPVLSPKVQFTPKGRKVLTCPATWQKGMTCAKCGICQSADPRRAIIGFPAHGPKRLAEAATINFTHRS